MFKLGPEGWAVGRGEADTLHEARKDQEGAAGLRENRAEASAWVQATVFHF